jgi:AcrR family transcriptional regulator
VTDLSVSKDDKGRRDGILNAAGETFIRYGFRKTSMDDVARAAGLSRQSLYAYFPTKEALFRDVVQHLVAATREAGRAALARENVDLEARLLDSFDAMYGSALSDEGSGHLNELVAAADQLVGDVFRNLERTTVADIARAFREHAVGVQWQKRGISATMLADHLYTVSYGLKQRGVPRAEYRERMRTAVRIVCRGAGG